MTGASPKPLSFNSVSVTCITDADSINSPGRQSSPTGHVSFELNPNDDLRTSSLPSATVTAAKGISQKLAAA